MCTHKLALNVIAEWFKARVFEWKRPECMSQVGCSLRRATRALRLSSFRCKTARTLDRRAEYESGGTYICKCWAEGKNKCASEDSLFLWRNYMDCQGRWFLTSQTSFLMQQNLGVSTVWVHSLSSCYGQRQVISFPLSFHSLTWRIHPLDQQAGHLL